MTNINTFEEGRLLLINKPLHWTSFDVVRKIRHLIKIKKVGHAGTLDPLATGLLLVCTGKFTKRIQEFMGLEKVYSGTFTLGATTPTFDLESEPRPSGGLQPRSREVLEQTACRFLGDILQVPPVHSAIKVEGQRVYKLARKGKNIKLEPRRIHISQFRITDINLPVVSFEVTCSTGTYIRSLANDYGEALGCGAYLSSLCRTRIGPYELASAWSVQQAEAHINNELDIQNG